MTLPDDVLRMLQETSFFAPGAWLLHLLGLHSKTMQGNWRAALLQYRALQRGLWCYNLLTARKSTEVVVPSVWEATALEDV